MSSHWTAIGNKYNLAKQLSKATSIPQSALHMEEDFTTKSIAACMPWAARRKTTRIEDEAYCLLGIFGVNMPTIYGEGQNVFYRLQEEIVKLYTDNILLAWGLRSESILTERKDMKEISKWETEITAPALLSSALSHSPEQFELSGDIETGNFITVSILIGNHSARV